MSAIKDSMKIVEMSEQQIDALKTIIDELTLSDEDKAAITYGLNRELSIKLRNSGHAIEL